MLLNLVGAGRAITAALIIEYLINGLMPVESTLMLDIVIMTDLNTYEMSSCLQVAK